MDSQRSMTSFWNSAKKIEDHKLKMEVQCSGSLYTTLMTMHLYYPNYNKKSHTFFINRTK